MPTFTKFSDAEIERRRALSVEALKQREREEWERQYQEHCDRLYWTSGKCCSGCDHWQSEMGNIGSCIDAGIVSGDQVMRSLGSYFSSYMPPPGFPLTKAEFYCGQFRDDFDWSTLDHDYLAKIGAIRNGELRQKPQAPIAKD